MIPHERTHVNPEPDSADKELQPHTRLRAALLRASLKIRSRSKDKG